MQFYKNGDYTGLDSISDLVFELVFNPNDINIADGSVAAASLAFDANVIDNTKGTLELDLSGAPVTDFTTPLVEFSVDKLNKNTAFEVAIEELSINSAAMDDVDEVLNFASVDVETTVVLRNGNSLSGVDLKYEFLSESNTDLVIPYQAGSTASEKVKRSLDLKISGIKEYENADTVTSEKAVDVNDVTGLLRLVSNFDTTDAFGLIASDINNDGVVNVNDVTALLRVVSNYDETPAKWLFVDGKNLDIMDITKTNVSYEEGITVNTNNYSGSNELVAILVGDVNGSYDGLV